MSLSEAQGWVLIISAIVLGAGTILIAISNFIIGLRTKKILVHVNSKLTERDQVAADAFRRIAELTGKEVDIVKASDAMIVLMASKQADADARASIAK